jgi:ethanolamine utilization protein EutQ (cupin superfamily)
VKVAKFTVADAPFERAPGQAGDVLLGNVVDEQDGGPITVGFGRYGSNQTLEDMVVADEAMVVTKGRLTVRSDDGEAAAGPGEVLYLPPGTGVVIAAHEEGAEIFYVTYPHWRTA